MKLILDLCGGTGAWSKPYVDAGYLVEVVTLPEKDVRLFEFPETPVHGILAAPPCTMFCQAGYRWKRTPEQMLEALSIVDACLRIIRMTNPIWWALENPVGRLRRWLGTPAYKFNPCDFGETYTKATYLWGKFNLPDKAHKVQPEFVIPKSGVRMSKVHYDSFRLPKEKRSEIRSQTPPGFAKAFFEANP